MSTEWAVGLDLGGTDLKAARVTRAGAIEGFLRTPSRTRENPDAAFHAVREAVEMLRAGADGPEVAVGLGCPGVIHPKSGSQVGGTAHLPHWRDVPLREWLAVTFARPAAVDNDANVAALAEQRLGAARGTRVSLTVTLGTGIGCGVIAEGRVLRGAFGGAGEIGHLPIGSGAVPCRCGVARCIEPEASGSGLVRAAREAGLDAADAAAVFAAASAGDEVAIGLVERMTDRLALVLGVAVNLFNPEVIAIGGGISRAGEALFGRLAKALPRYILPTHADGLRVVPAMLGERAGVAGAGLLAWERWEAERG